MATSTLEARGGCIIPQADKRGYHIVYREHETNYCPGCGRTHWYIGRSMAECAFCTTALPLENAPMIAGGAIVRTIRRPVFGAEHAYARGRRVISRSNFQPSVPAPARCRCRLRRPDAGRTPRRDWRGR